MATIVFMHMSGAKQNVRDKVGPLEDSARNIISQGFVTAEDLKDTLVMAEDLKDTLVMAEDLKDTLVMAEDLKDTLVQCLPERILVHYQFQMLKFRRLNLTIWGS